MRRLWPVVAAFAAAGPGCRRRPPACSGGERARSRRRPGRQRRRRPSLRRPRVAPSAAPRPRRGERRRPTTIFRPGADVPPGYGLVEVTAPAGARVRIDGAIAGAGPATSLVAAPGYHEVRVEQDGGRRRSRWSRSARARRRASTSARRAVKRVAAGRCSCCRDGRAGVHVQARVATAPPPAPPSSPARRDGGAAPGARPSCSTSCATSTRCALGHRGVLLDFGDPSMRDDLHPGSIARGDDEVVEHEGATWLRARSRARHRQLLLARRCRATPPTRTRTSRRACAASRRAASRSPSTASRSARGRSGKGEPRIVVGRCWAVSARDWRARARRCTSSGARAPARAARGDRLGARRHRRTGEPYAAPTRADVLRDATVGGRSLRALSLRAPGFVRCSGWVPANATLEASLATAGRGRRGGRGALGARSPPARGARDGARGREAASRGHRGRYQ